MFIINRITFADTPRSEGTLLGREEFSTELGWPIDRLPMLVRRYDSFASKHLSMAYTIRQSDLTATIVQTLLVYVALGVPEENTMQGFILCET